MRNMYESQEEFEHYECGQETADGETSMTNNIENEVEREDWEKRFDKRFTESSIDFRYKGDRDVVKWYITELLTSLTEQHQREKEELLDALNWILPMAKGYAHTNDVGRNKEIIKHAEEIATNHNITINKPTDHE